MPPFPSAPSCPGNLRLAAEECRMVTGPFEATWSHLRTIVAITSAYCVACQPGQGELPRTPFGRSSQNTTSTPPGEQELKTNTSRSIDPCFTYSGVQWY